mmetsp:Transcript_67712/g.120567  ORF Transcript_67712/g.120567 Transcript_67712/m.120567 type:complete len:236 (-) Transcript_67712:462-1169(-)
MKYVHLICHTLLFGHPDICVLLLLEELQSVSTFFRPLQSLEHLRAYLANLRELAGFSYDLHVLIGSPHQKNLDHNLLPHLSKTRKLEGPLHLLSHFLMAEEVELVDNEGHHHCTPASHLEPKLREYLRMDFTQQLLYSSGILLPTCSLLVRLFRESSITGIQEVYHVRQPALQTCIKALRETHSSTHDSNGPLLGELLAAEPQSQPHLGLRRLLFIHAFVVVTRAANLIPDTRSV